MIAYSSIRIDKHSWPVVNHSFSCLMYCTAWLKTKASNKMPHICTVLETNVIVLKSGLMRWRPIYCYDSIKPKFFWKVFGKSWKVFRGLEILSRMKPSFDTRNQKLQLSPNDTFFSLKNSIFKCRNLLQNTKTNFDSSKRIIKFCRAECFAGYITIYLDFLFFPRWYRYFESLLAEEEDLFITHSQYHLRNPRSSRG